MRLAVALALALHLSGVPAAVPKACAMAAGVPQHSCCMKHAGAASVHLSATCGCQMSPASSAPAPSVAATVPDALADQAGLATVPTAMATYGQPSAHTHHDTGPPGPDPGSSSRLLASGFRC